MSHVYPIATTAEKALAEEAPRVRTRREAENHGLTSGKLEGLTHDWIRLRQDDEGQLKVSAEKGRDLGFVQSYEDADNGDLVYAVTYWKVSAPVEDTTQLEKEVKESPKPASDNGKSFSSSVRKPKKVKKRKTDKTDGRQLDLFAGPDQQGYERRDPNNPKIILALDEGDGTSFGL